MKNAFLSACVWICLFLLSYPVSAATAPPEVGGVLPQIILAAPANPEYLKYLGLKSAEGFTIPQIKAQVVIVEIFSMYCPHCQREAPTVNALFNKITNDEKLKDKLKLIGIGVGNSEFEVDVFRKNYKIAFPLFADADFKIHKMIGEVRTPYFIGVKINPDGTHRVIYSKLGGIKDVANFIDQILRLSEK